jgi:hypothetical protein
VPIRFGERSILPEERSRREWRPSCDAQRRAEGPRDRQCAGWQSSRPAPPQHRCPTRERSGRTRTPLSATTGRSYAHHVGSTCSGYRCRTDAVAPERRRRGVATIVLGQIRVSGRMRERFRETYGLGERSAVSLPARDRALREPRASCSALSASKAGRSPMTCLAAARPSTRASDTRFRARSRPRPSRVQVIQRGYRRYCFRW